MKENDEKTGIENSRQMTGIETKQDSQQTNI